MKSHDSELPRPIGPPYKVQPFKLRYTGSQLGGLARGTEVWRSAYDIFIIYKYKSILFILAFSLKLKVNERN